MEKLFQQTTVDLSGKGILLSQEIAWRNPENNFKLIHWMCMDDESGLQRNNSVLYQVESCQFLRKYKSGMYWDLALFQ